MKTLGIALAIVFALTLAALFTVLAWDLQAAEGDPPREVAAQPVAAQPPQTVSDRSLPADDEQKHDTDYWMQVKLTAAQEVFADLTRGDLESVKKRAQTMQVIDMLEQWLRDSPVQQKSEYKRQLNEFQFSTRELIRHAEDNNIDGALTAWLDISKSCVGCHKVLRDTPGS